MPPYVSCRFHGKPPSKNKQDKRFKKIMEEQERKRRAMSDIDESHTVSKQLKEQERTATPYVVCLFANFSTLGCPIPLLAFGLRKRRWHNPWTQSYGLLD